MTGTGRDHPTKWITISVTPLDGAGEPIDDRRESVKIAIDPEEPECIDDHDHEWKSPIEVVGGIKENPGVWGHGGSVTIHTICCHCGHSSPRRSLGARSVDGEQGLTSTEYREPDEESLHGCASKRYGRQAR